MWTAPIKALVAEKFFDLVDLLGAQQVGLATGDASINSDAPVLVCTAEVLANNALARGAASDFGFACLDEFHYYADPDRGWAWQVPLLELTGCQMLLASATLGDMTAIASDLEQRSGPRQSVGLDADGRSDAAGEVDVSGDQPECRLVSRGVCLGQGSHQRRAAVAHQLQPFRQG